MTKGLIGLAMIAKNDAERIKDALRSCKRYCSQLVVVDTGSKDTTPHSAKLFGTEVYKFDWNDSFSAARNFALSKMRTEWILVLDTDEVLEKVDLNQIKNADEKTGGFTVNIKNMLADNSDTHYSNHRYTRIFRNNPNFSFSGRVHEQIRDSIEASGYKIEKGNFEIIHSGYNRIDESKLLRNLKLLKEDARELPQDDFIQYHIAQTYFALREIYEARERFYRILDSPQLSEEQKDFARIRIAQTLLEDDQYDSIIAMCEGKKCANTELEGMKKYILGAVYLSMKDFKKAYELYTSDEVFESGMTDKTMLQKVLATLSKYK